MAIKNREYSGDQRDTLGPELHLPSVDSRSDDRQKGGWVTLPFIIGSTVLLCIASNGAYANLIVYLVQRFNVNRISAVQILNVFNGSTNMAPVVGAIVSDSYLGCFLVILISSIISFMGLIPLTLTAALPSLRPPPCIPSGNSCSSPSWFQYATLYVSLGLVGVGVGGTRFTMVTFGANQFEDPKSQEVCINWFFIAVYIAMIISATVVVFVEDNIGWVWGYGICLAANAVSVGVFLLSKRRYRDVRPQGSPFVDVARVVVAAARKRRMPLSANTSDYFCQEQGVMKNKTLPLTPNLGWLNKAALRIDGDTEPDGSVAKPWRLCTTQQVEDLKTVLKILPLRSSAIFMSIGIGVQTSMVVLQALTMDRHLGPRFSIPPGSFMVFTLLSGTLFVAFLDRVAYPLCLFLLGRSPSLLHRIGVGHVLTVISMVASAFVEERRLHLARRHEYADQPNAAIPMSALWLVLPLALVGAGEAFQAPGQVSLYYEEFPLSLKNTATAMIALIIGLGFYLSAFVVKIVRKSTGWLPSDINHGRVDNVYWMLAVVGVLNFGYYILCAKMYKMKGQGQPLRQ